MVDAVVSFVVQRFGELLIEQVIFHREVRDEVQWLRNKLEYMLCFLKDAEEKQDGDPRIQKWISDIKDVAYDAEDIIDNFIIEVEEGRTPKRFKGWFGNYLSTYTNQASLFGIGTEINLLKKKLQEIQHNQEFFKIENIGDSKEDLARGRLNQQRKERPYKDNELVVGFENDVELLMSKLMKEDSQRWVVSIVGMGGLGKTTLARKLYNTISLREQFNFYGWVSVSKDYNIQDLLQRAIKSFKKPTTKEEFEMLEKMKEEDLESYLRDILEGGRYLVVFDDVWDEIAWKSLRRALPDNKNGSRVIITTRQKVVAERLNERTYVHELPFLGEMESWELFCKRVLSNCNEVDDKNSCIPQKLESMAREMVRKCRGLPLAIVLLGGLLSRTYPEKWSKVQKHMWRYVRDDNTDVQHILALSFQDLPHHLKSCFLYLGLFPEDFEIDADELYRLLVAEGFLKLDEDSEEMAAKYLKELCDRSLLQVAKKKWRRIISYRIHDLLRDFAIEKSKELNFLQFYDGAPVSNSRRLALPCEFQRFVSLDHSNLRLLRTFHLFNLENESAEIDQLVLVCKKLRLLRVLNLWDLRPNSSQGREQNRLAEAIGKLIHLRYLGLDSIQIHDLSPFIGNLQALQTLELKGDLDNPILLPDEICKAKQLRHLLGAFKWPFRVDNLTNLRTLKVVVVEDQMEFDPMNLINLRELWVCIVGQNNIFTLDSVGRLRSQQSFHLCVRSDGSPWFPPLRPLSHCQQLLQLRLANIRPRWKLPTELHEFLPNLKYLLLATFGSMLEYTNKSEDPMPILEKLPQLTILELIGYRVNKFVCTARGFPQLQFLHIDDCIAEEFQVEEGGMPLLKGLTVTGSVRIPKRLKSIPAIPWAWSNDPFNWAY